MAEFLVGRSHELDSIHTFLAAAAADGAALLLAAQPGLGKSALIAAAARMAAAAGTEVVQACGVQFEADVSYSTLNQLLLPLQDDLDRLAEQERAALSVALGLGGRGKTDQSLVADAAVALVRAAATTRPLLLLVDDLHWADPMSAAVLGRLARDLTGSRVGFLGATRGDGEGFFDLAGLDVLELRPLSRDDATALISTRFPLVASRVQQRLLTEAEGNPLALLELPRALTERQRAALETLPPVLPLNRRLHSLFATRVEELPAPTRHLLLLAALDGLADLAVLSAAQPGRSLPADLAPADRAGLAWLDEATQRVRFRHPLMSATVVEISTSAERRRAHSALAAVLTGSPERQALHLAEAAVEPDEHVAGLLEQLSRAVLRRGDAVGATAALLRSAELSPDRSDRAHRLAEAAYVGAQTAGALRDAAKLLSDARQTGRGLSASLPASMAASYLLLHQEGDIDAAHRLLVNAIEAHAEDGETGRAELLEALETLLMVCLWSEREELWESFIAALGRLRPGEAPILDLQFRALADPVRTAASTKALLTEELRKLRRELDTAKISRVASAATSVDRVRDCRDVLWRVIDDAREGGAVAAGLHALTALSFEAFMTGAWDEAQELSDEGLAICRARGFGLQAWTFRLGHGLVAAARGDFDTAEAVADEMTRWAIPRGLGKLHTYARHVRVLVALGRSDFENAYQEASAISPPGVFPPYVSPALRVPMYLTEAAVRTNRHAEAAAHLQAMRAANLAGLSPRLALIVAGSAAIAAPDDRMVELFEHAIGLPGAERWPFDLARIHLAYGERLRRAKATTKSRQPLTTALDMFDRLGAEPWLVRTRNELLATGQTKARGHGLGPAALTPQEREVAQLAAAGLSNKQIAERLFLSHRTVGAHLHQVFPKLRVSSRAALRDALDSMPAGQPARPPAERARRRIHLSPASSAAG